MDAPAQAAMCQRQFHQPGSEGIASPAPEHLAENDLAHIPHPSQQGQAFEAFLVATELSIRC
jgi:hypothetical protein